MAKSNHKRPRNEAAQALRSGIFQQKIIPKRNKLIEEQIDLEEYLEELEDQQKEEFE